MEFMLGSTRGFLKLMSRVTGLSPADDATSGSPLLLAPVGNLIPTLHPLAEVSTTEPLLFWHFLINRLSLWRPESGPLETNRKLKANKEIAGPSFEGAEN
jgi:hypothetical protein